MYAVDDLSDAIDVTREFLTPVRLGLWLRLLIVVFFIGGLGFGGPGIPTGDVGMVVDEPTVETEPVDEEVPIDDLLTEEVLIAVAVLVVIGALLWLLFAVLRAIMDFVFIESLRTTEVHIRRYGREYLGSALRLFAFRAIAGLLAVGIIAVPAAVAVLTAEDVTAAAGVLVLLAVLAIPLGIGYAIVMRFTTVFVAPVMVLEDRAVLSAWRRFLPTLRSNLAEYAVYVLLVWILQIVISIAVGFLALFGLLVIGIPFGIAAVVALAFGTPGVVLAVVLVIVAFVLFLLFVALVEVPVYTYLRYYALLVLGDTNRELDLIPDQRAAVRDGGPETRDDDDGPNGDGPATDRTDDSWETRDWDDDRDEGWEPSDWDDDRDDDANDDRDGGWR